MDSVQDLIDGTLSPEQQAALFGQQAQQFAAELLGHLSNVQRLEAEAALLPAGNEKDQLLAAIAESRAAMAVVERALVFAREKAGVVTQQG